MKLARRAAVEAAKLLVVLWLVSVLVFLALRLTPGDPAVLLLGPQAGRPDAAATLERLRQEMGLDQPWPVQYAIWLGNILGGDFGESARSGEPVVALILQALPSTLWLIGLTVLVSVPIAVLLGMRAAYRPTGWLARVVRGGTTVAIAVPGVWLGLLLIILFSVTLRALPSGGFVDPFDDLGGFLSHMVLPVLTLAVFLAAVLTRFVYAEAVDVFRQDYMRTALAMGLSERRRVFVYATRNAVLPMITIVGVQIGALIGGGVLVEAVFGLGGLGQLLLSSVLNRDYLVVQGAVLLTTVFVLLIGYLADIAYRLVDPRISK
ncbi:ABC transporter permease [Microbacterium tenebrionis]|uniref:ABC transporter permease n=1 Tax=Microbacterium tenebrionis TaxID=2830665 RepID=UPI00158E5ED1|nr:ABC transporter permease [Microbacterium ihumii]